MERAKRLPLPLRPHAYAERLRPSAPLFENGYLIKSLHELPEELKGKVAKILVSTDGINGDKTGMIRESFEAFLVSINGDNKAKIILEPGGIFVDIKDLTTALKEAKELREGMPEIMPPVMFFE
ncbi:MAG: hypothetical protein QW035_01240 [Candidatus Anstonellales archaeon]